MEDNWQLEMDRMLDVVEHESESSLRKINCRFEVLGRPFNDELRQYFMKMAAHRLDSSFTKIEMERWDNGQIKNIEEDDRKIIPNCITSATASSSGATTHVQLPKNDDDICLIVENEKGIEISDSDDEDDGIKSKRSDEMQNINTVEMNDSATENQNEPTNRNDEAPLKLMELKIVLHQCNDGSVMESGDSNDENSNSSIVVKDVNSPGDQLMESIDENDECFKLNAPMNVEIDCSSNEVELMNEAENNPPIALKSSQETDHSCTENGQTKQQANSLTMASNQSKRITNRFKYVPRDSSSRIKGKLKQYQRVRANGKLIGASSNSNGLHQCTLCARRFTDMHHLSRHMKAHNDGQYMYDCAPCMWQFVEEVRKDWHESQWNGRHYKCYLCKAYVTPFKFDMYRHMQTHTGAFRF